MSSRTRNNAHNLQCRMMSVLGMRGEDAWLHDRHYRSTTDTHCSPALRVCLCLSSVLYIKPYGITSSIRHSEACPTLLTMIRQRACVHRKIPSPSFQAYISATSALVPFIICLALTVIAVLSATNSCDSLDPSSDCDTTISMASTAARALTQRAVSRIVTTRQQKEGGGFLVRRAIGSLVSDEEADPFLMLDHMGPVVYPPGKAVGAPDHPHRGFETVTYVLEGGFHHKDSKGNEGNLTDGWVQWMTAGSGVIHSEMPTDELIKKGGRMEGFQLWVNLPAKDKMIPPRYQDTPPEKIPKTKSSDGLVSVSIIAGQAFGVNAIIETRSPMYYLDVVIQPGGEFVEPIGEEYNSFAYVYRGKGVFGADSKAAQDGQVVVFGKGTGVRAAAPDTECRFLLLAGVPLKEPVARYGPFVMNTEEQLREAFADYRSGRFGDIPGAEERYEKTRRANEHKA